MKFKIGFFFFLFFLLHCSSLEEQSKKNIKIKTQIKKHKATANFKKKSSNIKSKNNTKRKTVKKLSKKRLLAKENQLLKEDVLPKDYYKAKRSKEELEQEFETHLQNLKQTCELKTDQIVSLKKQLKAFDSFLKISLKDPFMDYPLKLLFADISSLLEEINYNKSINLDSFIQFYKMLYNLPEDIKIEDYSDKWAKVIAQSMKCIQQTKKPS